MHCGDSSISLVGWNVLKSESLTTQDLAARPHGLACVAGAMMPRARRCPGHACATWARWMMGATRVERAQGTSSGAWVAAAERVTSHLDGLQVGNRGISRPDHVGDGVGKIGSQHSRRETACGTHETIALAHEANSRENTAGHESSINAHYIGEEPLSSA